MQGPSVLLLDDGELQSAREVLDRLDVEVVWQRNLTVKPWTAGKHQLLVTTALRALASKNAFHATPRSERPVWIAFHNQDFLPLRERLRQVGVDYLVHTMVEPELLRLLFLRVLFSDHERRTTRRLPAGASVTCRLGNRQISATLAEISPGGCLLLSSQPTELNAPLILELPPELGDSTGTNRIPGRVARVERIAREPECALWKIGIEFERVSGSPAPSLERLETGRAIGARVTCFEDARVAQAAPSPSASAEETETHRAAVSPADTDRTEVDEPKLQTALRWEDALELEEIPKDRRVDPRASLSGKQITLLDEESGIVFGRDLSRRGVRIEHRAGISVGTTLSLAIPGLHREEPLLIRAIVSRDDGPDGLAVLFYEAGPEDLDRLDRIVAALPPIETLADDPLVPEHLLVVDWPDRDRS